MRPGCVFAIPAVVALCLAVAPADARDGGAVVIQFGAQIPGHFGAARILNGSSVSRGTGSFVFDRAARRVVALGARPRRLRPVFDDLGFDGLIGTPAVYGVAQPGAVSVLPAPPEAAQPAPSQPAADLPPCHETTSVGVVILRGTACSHAP
jgi:hypothetical protein